MQSDTNLTIPRTQNRRTAALEATRAAFALVRWFSTATNVTRILLATTCRPGTIGLAPLATRNSFPVAEPVAIARLVIDRRLAATLRMMPGYVHGSAYPNLARQSSIPQTTRR